MVVNVGEFDFSKINQLTFSFIVLVTMAEKLFAFNASFAIDLTMKTNLKTVFNFKYLVI